MTKFKKHSFIYLIFIAFVFLFSLFSVYSNSISFNDDEVIQENIYLEDSKEILV